MGRVGLMNEERVEQHKRGVFRGLKYVNVAKPFPFASESASVVYSAHMLEHLTPAVARQCLTECYRVLMRGGLLRIVVPDLDHLVRSYDPLDPDPFLDAVFEIHSGSNKNRHWWHYNEWSLAHLLESIGFRQPKRCDFRRGQCPDIANFEIRPESLFMEAVK